MTAPIDFDTRARALLISIGIYPHPVDGMVTRVSEKLQAVALKAGDEVREACAELCERPRCRQWQPEECASQIRTRSETDPAALLHADREAQR